MPNQRCCVAGLVLAAALALLSTATTPLTAAAQAAEAMAFTPTAFEAAKASGKPILVDVTAPWCPTCRAQAPVLAKLLADPAYAEFVIFRIDFDSQKAALKKLGVAVQGTLIAYRGGREAARSTGDTSPAGIRALLDTAF